jgi:hypothetical protein
MWELKHKGMSSIKTAVSTGSVQYAVGNAGWAQSDVVQVKSKVTELSVQQWTLQSAEQVMSSQ